MQKVGRKGQVVLRDPKAIRALAHPARLLVIERLFTGSPATATELAHQAGLSPSAMSYHLRALERFGVVERADPTGDGRERPWRATGRGITVDSSAPSATRAVEGALLGAVLDGVREDIDAFLTVQAGESTEWREALTLDHLQLTVTVEELAALRQEISALTGRYAAGRRRRPPHGARPVRLTTVIVPHD